MKTILAPFALLVLSAAAPAPKLHVVRSIDIAAAPATVWRTIGGFCGIGDWHPAIAGCALGTGGKVRNLTLGGGGGTIVERQVSRDDGRMRYTYAIESGPLPVAHYRSTISVARKGTGSVVTWSGDFDAAGAPDAAARDAIAGVYTSGLDGLKAKATAG